MSDQETANLFDRAFVQEQARICKKAADASPGPEWQTVLGCLGVHFELLDALLCRHAEEERPIAGVLRYKVELDTTELMATLAKVEQRFESLGANLTSTGPTMDDPQGLKRHEELAKWGRKLEAAPLEQHPDLYDINMYDFHEHLPEDWVVEQPPRPVAIDAVYPLYRAKNDHVEIGVDWARREEEFVCWEAHGNTSNGVGQTYRTNDPEEVMPWMLGVVGFHKQRQASHVGSVAEAVAKNLTISNRETATRDLVDAELEKLKVAELQAHHPQVWEEAERRVGEGPGAVDIESRYPAPDFNSRWEPRTRHIEEE